MLQMMVPADSFETVKLGREVIAKKQFVMRKEMDVAEDGGREAGGVKSC